MQTPIGKSNLKKTSKFSIQFTQTLPNMLDNDFVFKIDFKTYYEIPYLSGHKVLFCCKRILHLAMFQLRIYTVLFPIT